jgi:hypothetical protein
MTTRKKPHTITPKRHRLSPRQRELARGYATITGFDIVSLPEVTDSASFWVVWDSAVTWWEHYCEETQRNLSYLLTSPESQKLYEARKGKRKPAAAATSTKGKKKGR